VELVVPESAPGLDVAGAFGDREQPLGDDPLCRCVVLRGDPFVLILAIEEDDGVRGRRVAGGAGRDDGRDGLPDFRVLGFGFGFLGGDKNGRGEKNEGAEDGGFHLGSVQQGGRGSGAFHSS
jgi:hypothetical protein